MDSQILKSKLRTAMRDEEKKQDDQMTLSQGCLKIDKFTEGLSIIRHIQHILY